MTQTGASAAGKKVAASVLSGGLSVSGIEAALVSEGGDGYRIAVRVLMRFVQLQLVAIVVLTVLLVHLIYEGRPADRYFALSFDERRTLLSSLSDPSINDKALLAWVTGAAIEALNFGFHNTNERISAAYPYFTKVGWESFVRGMAKSNLLRTVVEKQQIVTTIPKDVATIVYRGLRNGEYVYDVQVPVVMTFRAGGVSTTEMPLLIITVVQVPTKVNPAGFGILQWRMM